MNTYLKYQPPGVQFVAFMGLAMGLFVVNGLLANFFFEDVTRLITDKNAAIPDGSAARFKLLQLMSAVLSFVVPALLFGYFSSPKMFSYLGVRSNASFLLVMMSILLLMVSQVFVGYLGSLNAKINFGSMQKTIQEAEATYTRSMQIFLKMGSAKDLVVNLLVMALLPAVAEELFFRGALQKVLLRLTNHPWAAIIVTSVIFSILHLTIFKVIPIFLLSIILGALYHYTRNLWYNIIVHFCNNALAVVAIYFSSQSQVLKNLATDKISISWYGAAISLVLTVVLIYFIAKRSNEVLPATVVDEDNDMIA